MSSDKWASAFTSFGAGVSNVLSTGKLSSWNSSGSRLMSSSRKNEISELREQLNSPSREKKKQAVRKVIAAMTLGRDVASLFPQMVNCLQTSNLELKKLVYLYVINFARSKPELALLAINTFRKDTLDPSPLVRALAIRTLGCLKVEQIVEYLIEPLHRLLLDPDPYVRKSAVLSVAKLYQHAAEGCVFHGFIDALISILSDSKETSPAVLVSAVAALDDIQQMKTLNTKIDQHAQSPSANAPVFHLDFSTVRSLVSSLPDFNEWGQVIIMDFLSSYYLPKNDPKENELVDKLYPRLVHANAAVVMSCCRLLCVLTERWPMAQRETLMTKKLGPSLFSLLSTETSQELLFAVLRCIQVIGELHPSIFTADFNAFYITYNDPPYIKAEKLNLLISSATRSVSFDDACVIARELGELVHDSDLSTVCSTIAGIGRIAILRPKTLSCVNKILAQLMDTRISFVLEETLFVLRDLMTHFHSHGIGQDQDKISDEVMSIDEELGEGAEDPVALLCPLLFGLASMNHQIESVDALGALAFLVGEFGDKIPEVDVLIKWLYETWLNSCRSNASFENEILTMFVKVYLKLGVDYEKTMKIVINENLKETRAHPDLRDRAFFYNKILMLDKKMALSIVCAPRPRIDSHYFLINKSPKLLNQIGLCSSIFQHQENNFVAKSVYAPHHLEHADTDATEADEDEKMKTDFSSSNKHSPAQPQPSQTRTRELLDLFED